MTISYQTKGYAAAVLSACSFGFIPMFVLPLRYEGFSATDILIYRTLFCAILLFLSLLIQRKRVQITIQDLFWLVLGGILYFFSAWFLVLGYEHISSGLATTLHFSYPVFVVLWMILCWGETPSRQIIIAILLAVIGVAAISLFASTAIGGVSLWGLTIILFSGFTYATYIVVLKQTRLSALRGEVITFYVMLIAASFFTIISLLQDGNIKPLETSRHYSNAILLAFVPTIISNLSLVIAVRHIGSSKTAVLGALEPVTALVIGVLLFDETVGIGAAIGVALILTAVYLVLSSSQKNL